MCKLGILWKQGTARVERWISNIERTFEVCRCTEYQKVLYASYLLQGETTLWWDTQRNLLTMELGAMRRISWEMFKKKFDNCYEIIRKQRSKDFTNLVLGNITVEQYAVKFMELGRFALRAEFIGCIPNSKEVNKCR